MEHNLDVVASRLVADDLTFEEWRMIQPEITKLHDDARSESDYIDVLKVHRHFLNSARRLLDAETFVQISDIHQGEYKLFLNAEAMEEGVVNPAMLDRITAREVAAGRLAKDDPFREFARAGGQILGDSSTLSGRRERPGNWLFIGMAVAAVLGLVLQHLDHSLLWLIPLGLVAGYFPNAAEQKRVVAEIEARRALR